VNVHPSKQKSGFLPLFASHIPPPTIPALLRSAPNRGRRRNQRQIESGNFASSTTGVKVLRVLRIHELLALCQAAVDRDKVQMCSPYKTTVFRPPFIGLFLLVFYFNLPNVIHMNVKESIVTIKVFDEMRERGKGRKFVT
ncbi:hypothetical protein M8C21_029027, partial [Ambrosia artemisiifolia]